MPRKPLGSDPIPWTSEDPRKPWSPGLPTLWKLGQMTYVNNSAYNSSAVYEVMNSGFVGMKPLFMDG